MKTNVMRILDANKISYEVFEYEPNQKLTGNDIASILNENPKACFKTLITEAKSKEYYAFMVPVIEELDLKKAAKAVNEKNVAMIPFKDLLKVTGYIHGGCSPIGLKKPYKVTIDESCLNNEYIYFSAGKVGAQVKLKLEDFLKIVNPNIESITN